MIRRLMNTHEVVRLEAQLAVLPLMCVFVILNYHIKCLCFYCPDLFVIISMIMVNNTFKEE